MRTAKGIAIYPSKEKYPRRIDHIELSTLKDYQEVVEGYIEAVNLKFGTLWVNEEFLLGQFDASDANFIASDLAGLGGRTDLLFNPILGPAILTGPPDMEGETQDVTEDGIQALHRITQEAITD